MVRFAVPELGRKDPGWPGNGESGLWKHGQERVEAEDTVPIVMIRVVRVRPLWLITARIMPTPGTEVAKASLADSSVVCSSRQDKVATAKLPRQFII